MILVLGLSSWTPWENKAKKIIGKVISKIKLLTSLGVQAKHSKVCLFLEPGIDTSVRQWIDWIASDIAAPTWF